MTAVGKELSKPILVTYHHRRRWPASNFSIESIFENLRHDLGEKIDSRVVQCPHHSKGFLPRVANVLHARRCQNGINHVTGEVNFLAIGLDRKRTILTHHDASFMVRTSGIKRFILGLFWLRLPVKFATLVTTVSEASKQELVAYTNCDPDKIVVIHNAISTQFQHVPKESFGSPTRILQIGTAVNKNIPRLAKALAGIDCQLVVIGTLNDQQSLALESAGIEFENLVDLTDEEVREQYVLSDIVAFASTIEGFGMPILEAQATGRPVVTSDCSSMPEVAGNAACLVNPLDVCSIRDGIKKVIEDHDYRQTLIEAGLQNVKRFQRMEVAMRYLGLYQRIASQLKD